MNSTLQVCKGRARIAGLGGTTTVADETERNWKLVMHVNINGAILAVDGGVVAG